MEIRIVLIFVLAVIILGGANNGGFQKGDDDIFSAIGLCFLLFVLYIIFGIEETISQRKIKSYLKSFRKRFERYYRKQKSNKKPLDLNDFVSERLGTTRGHRGFFIKMGLNLE